VGVVGLEDEGGAETDTCITTAPRLETYRKISHHNQLHSCEQSYGPGTQVYQARETVVFMQT